MEWGDGGAPALAAAALVIDGIVGLGGVGGLRDEAVDAVAAIPAHTKVVAVDLPSGLDPDSGAAGVPHVRADVTVTFTAPKICLVREPAAASAGRVVVADVGVSL
jgi:NAD(P)H-hydrate repair Nnr-like enzyme with NAD(P)H-hydrate epimerase domain